MLKVKEKEVMNYDPDFWMNEAHRKREEKKQKEFDDMIAELGRELEEEKLGDLPEEYYNCDWQDTPNTVQDNKSLTQNDFFRMEWKEIQYHLYKQLLSISSLLTDIKEVLSNDRK